mgnify:CR=1 FL=1
MFGEAVQDALKTGVGWSPFKGKGWVESQAERGGEQWE